MKYIISESQYDMVNNSKDNLKDLLYGVVSKTRSKFPKHIKRRIDTIIDTLILIMENTDPNEFREPYIYADIVLENTVLNIPDDIGIDNGEIYDFLDIVFYDFLVNYCKSLKKE